MRVLVVIPTYREAENIGLLLRQLRATVPRADLLVVDDASGDGTARVARETGAELGGVDVLERPAKDGLGRAYRAGFTWGLAREYEVLVSMDADSPTTRLCFPRCSLRSRAVSDNPRPGRRGRAWLRRRRPRRR